jgi:peptidoglycan/LPS O-acetylase OafA/YrhL
MKKVYLELVRGGAAMLVLITHVAMLHPKLKSPDLNIIANWGTESVMIFFILSGIVINISQTRTGRSGPAFIGNRLLRLYPQFLAGLFLGLLVIGILKFRFPSFPQVIGNIFMLSTLQGYICSTLVTNSPVWSITFEMFFYLLFAIAIGPRLKKYIWFWLALSLLTMPLYYQDMHNGILNHLIAMLSFSSIWLIGYFIYEFRLLFHFDRVTSVISLGLLPLVSRLNLSDQYYDPFKFLCFAIVSVPFFHFCLQEGKGSGKRISRYYMLGIYAVLVLLLFYGSRSLMTSKVMYAVLPAILIVIYFFIRQNGLSAGVKKYVEKTAIFTGKYSYSLYIIHYPILFVCGHFFNNLLIYLFIGLTSIAFFIWVLESFYQQYVVALFKSSARRALMA